MVRAKVVNHPSEWRYGGYHEICGNRKRYQIIDQNKLLNMLQQKDILRFREWYNNTLNELFRQKDLPEEKFWSSSFAVGSPDWFKNMLLLPDGINDKYLKQIKESSDTHIINPPQSVLVRLWKNLKTK